MSCYYITLRILSDEDYKDYSRNTPGKTYSNLVLSYSEFEKARDNPECLLAHLNSVWSRGRRFWGESGDTEFRWDYYNLPSSPHQNKFNFYGSYLARYEIVINVPSSSYVSKLTFMHVSPIINLDYVNIPFNSYFYPNQPREDELKENTIYFYLKANKKKLGFIVTQKLGADNNLVKKEGAMLLSDIEEVATNILSGFSRTVDLAYLFSTRHRLAVENNGAIQMNNIRNFSVPDVLAKVLLSLAAKQLGLSSTFDSDYYFPEEIHTPCNLDLALKLALFTNLPADILAHMYAIAHNTAAKAPPARLSAWFDKQKSRLEAQHPLIHLASRLDTLIARLEYSQKNDYFLSSPQVKIELLQKLKVLLTNPTYAEYKMGCIPNTVEEIFQFWSTQEQFKNGFGNLTNSAIISSGRSIMGIFSESTTSKKLAQLRKEFGALPINPETMAEKASSRLIR